VGVEVGGHGGNIAEAAGMSAHLLGEKAKSWVLRS
jgi:ribosomal protein L2